MSGGKHICGHCLSAYFDDVCPNCDTICDQEYLRRPYDTEICSGCGKKLYGATRCTECKRSVPGTVRRK